MMTRTFASACADFARRSLSVAALAGLVLIASGCGSKICKSEDYTCAEELTMTYSVEVEHLGTGDCQWPVAKLKLEIEGEGKKNKTLSEDIMHYVNKYSGYQTYAQIRWYYKDNSNPNFLGDDTRTWDREALAEWQHVFVAIPMMRQLSRLTYLNAPSMPFDVANFEALRLYGDIGKDYIQQLSAGKPYGPLFAGLSCTPEKTKPDTGTKTEWFKQLFDDCPAGLPLPHCRGLDTARLLELKTKCDDETKAGGADKPSCTAYEQAFKWKSSYTKAEFQADFIDRISHYKVTLEVKDGWHEATDGYENETATVQTLVICLDAQMKEITCPPEKAATIKKVNLKYDASPVVDCDGIGLQRFNLDAPCSKDDDCAKALGSASAKCVADKCAIPCTTDADCGGNPRLPPGTVCSADTKTCYSEVEQIFTPRLRSSSKLDFVQDDGKPWEASVSAYKAGTIPGVFVHSPSHYGDKGPSSLDLGATVDIPLPTRVSWQDFIEKILAAKDPPFLRAGWFHGEDVAGCAIHQLTFAGMVNSVSSEFGSKTPSESIDGRQIHYRFPVDFSGVSTATEPVDWCYVVSKEEDGKLVPPDFNLRPKAGQKSGECTACYAKDKACGASSDCCSGLTCDKDKKTCQYPTAPPPSLTGGGVLV